MPDITCPLCNKAYLIENPNDRRDFVKPTGDSCVCAGDTKLYIATDSSLDDGNFKCPEGPYCYSEPTWDCSSCDGQERVDYDRIVDLLKPFWAKDYEVGDWNFYTPTTLDAYFENATEIWYGGCDHFGTYDETGCWNCMQEEQNVGPEAVHVNMRSGESGEWFTIDMTKYVDEDSDISRSDGSLWIADGTELRFSPLMNTLQMLSPIIINRINVR